MGYIDKETALNALENSTKIHYRVIVDDPEQGLIAFEYKLAVPKNTDGSYSDNLPFTLVEIVTISQEEYNDLYGTTKVLQKISESRYIK